MTAGAASGDGNKPFTAPTIGEFFDQRGSDLQELDPGVSELVTQPSGSRLGQQLVTAEDFLQRPGGLESSLDLPRPVNQKSLLLLPLPRLAQQAR